MARVFFLSNEALHGWKCQNWSSQTLKSFRAIGCWTVIVEYLLIICAYFITAACVSQLTVIPFVTSSKLYLCLFKCRWSSEVFITMQQEGFQLKAVHWDKYYVSAHLGLSKVQDKTHRSVNDSNRGANALCYEMHKMKYSFHYLLLSQFGDLKQTFIQKLYRVILLFCISFCHLWKSRSHHLATLWILSWSPLCQTCWENVKKIEAK